MPEDNTIEEARKRYNKTKRDSEEKDSKCTSFLINYLNQRMRNGLLKSAENHSSSFDIYIKHTGDDFMNNCGHVSSDKWDKWNNEKKVESVMIDKYGINRLIFHYGDAGMIATYDWRCDLSAEVEWNPDE